MKKTIARFIQKNIEKDLFKGKVIIIYGARQVGKTTLVKQIIKNRKEASILLNCDEPDIRTNLENKTSSELKSVIGPAKLVILDEAQRVRNIGLTLKLLADRFKNIQVVATGSSSFDLSNTIAEPLTGRSYEYTLYPLGELELKKHWGKTESQRNLEIRLRFGSYPEVFLAKSLAEKERLLNHLKINYLLKDVLAFEKVKGSDILYKLLQALALQIGQEVSLNELASLIGIDKNTVRRYINILEKGFVIFKLSAFSRNIRKEIGKKHKVYFYDLGIRNSLINNFNQPEIRNDLGQLWENYLIAERLKLNTYRRRFTNLYFWRTYDQQEIDLIEEKSGQIRGFELKWKKEKARTPKIFLEKYPESKVRLINRTNYFDFLTGQVK